MYNRPKMQLFLPKNHSLTLIRSRFLVLSLHTLPFFRSSHPTRSLFSRRKKLPPFKKQSFVALYGAFRSFPCLLVNDVKKCFAANIESMYIRYQLITPATYLIAFTHVQFLQLQCDTAEKSLSIEVKCISAYHV